MGLGLGDLIQKTNTLVAARNLTFGSLSLTAQLGFGTGVKAALELAEWDEFRALDPKKLKRLLGPRPTIITPTPRPVLLDLDNDGFDLIGLDSSSAFFDVDGDGFRDHVGWLMSDDGFLVIDKNSSGTIDLSEELVFASETGEDDSDLEALRAIYNSNGDGVLSASDAKWNQFKVWRDVDQDGQSDAGELTSLDTLGLQSIELTHNGRESEIAGSVVVGEAVFHGNLSGKVGDAQLSVSDYGFKYDQSSDSINLKIKADKAYNIYQHTGQLGAMLDAAQYDAVSGGVGNDTIVNSGNGSALLEGGNGADEIFGGNSGDWLVGGDGADLLVGGAYNDMLIFDGLDEVLGGAGQDTALLADDTSIEFNASQHQVEIVFGGSGNDRITSSQHSRYEAQRAMIL